MVRPNPFTWPIRWQLTALNVGLLAATLLAVGGLFLLKLDDALLDITTDHVRDEARPLIQRETQARQASPGVARLFPPRRPESETDQRNAAAPPFSAILPNLLVRRLAGPETGVFVFDGTGALITASEPAEGVEAWPRPSPEQVERALAGGEVQTVVAQQTRRTLLLLLPIAPSDEGVARAVGVTSSLQLVDQVELQLRAALIGGTLLAVFVAALLVLRATRAALRPLERVVLLARRIGVGDLGERLRFRRRDEVGELADAFDGMLDRLEQSLVAQRRFVADAAHELRTPLTALSGMVELLQVGADHGDPATQRRMLTTMEREIDRLGRLVADLLTLSRFDAGRQLVLTPVELGPLLSEVAEQARLLARGQTIAVRLDAAPTVLGEADRLRQLLLNLADNALKFTPPDGRIEFRLEQADGVARLVVADSGSGIPPEVLPRVTERFERGDPSRARATGGFGLGLAIARAIVEAHHGSIAIESQVGRGTTVTISLPLAHQAGVVDGAQPAAAAGPQPVGTPLRAAGG